MALKKVACLVIISIRKNTLKKYVYSNMTTFAKESFWEFLRWKQRTQKKNIVILD